MKLLLLSFRDASLESKKVCNDLSTELDEKTTLLKYAQELKSNEQLQNMATFRNLEQQLENKTGRIQELEEQLEKKARRMQQLEKARGSWFSVFLWLISVSFAMFVGAFCQASSGSSLEDMKRLGFN